MLILRIWNYVRGYVIIKVEGYFPEKFINVCINRGLFLWDINREKSCLITLKTGIDAFKNMKSIARKTRCRVKIKAKRGIPFISYRYQKRKTFVAGCLIFLVMVCILSSFVWTIEIYGNKKIPMQKISDNLFVAGLKPGTWKPIIDTEDISNKMMIRMQELAWISVDISGTRAKVEIAERVMPPEIIKKNIPCNIVATKNGLITSLIVKVGSPVVKVGDTVKKGDMIVAGMIESVDKKDIRYVHAMADVTARTWYEEAVNVSLERIVKKETGKVCNKYEIEIFNKLIGLGSTKVPYEYYNKQQIIRRVSLGKDNILPFGIVVNKYNEKKSYKEKISMENARIQALKGVEVKLTEIIPKNAQVKDKKTYMAPCKSGIKVRMLIECLEEIGVQEKIIY